MPMKLASSSDNASGHPLTRLLAAAARKGCGRDRPADATVIALLSPKMLAPGKRCDAKGRRQINCDPGPFLIFMKRLKNSLFSAMWKA